MTLGTVSIPVAQLCSNQPVYHGTMISGANCTSPVANYYAAPDAQTYFGGEPVLDPITGAQLTYTHNDPVRDLFTGAILKDPFGNNVMHADGDPMLHIAGDPVVHQRGETVLYLGGEPVTDEQGNPVYTGSQRFTHDADQGVIYDRRQTVYALIDASGHPQAIDAAGYDAPAFALSGIQNGTFVTLAYDVKTGVQVSVIVYD